MQTDHLSCEVVHLAYQQNLHLLQLSKITILFKFRKYMKEKEKGNS